MRLSDVALPDSLSGGFAEGISADPDTGDLYVGSDDSANGSALTGFILKAGSQQNSFSDWALRSTLATPGSLVTGTRVRSGVIDTASVTAAKFGRKAPASARRPPRATAPAPAQKSICPPAGA